MPAEHGAWGILLVPFLVATWIAQGWGAPVLLCGGAALALFLLRGSLDAQGAGAKLVQWELEQMRSPGHALLAAIFLACSASLFFHFERYALLPLGIAAALGYLLQRVMLKRHREESREKRSLGVELLGVALLSLSAPAAWIAARGSLDALGARIWLLNLLFFLGGVLYVKYRVRGLFAKRDFPSLAERLSFAWPVFFYHLMILALLLALVWLRSLPAAAAVAFLPGVARAYSLLGNLGERFPIKRLGWSEVIHSMIFAALLVLAFQQ
jgi:hypothetical protein